MSEGKYFVELFKEGGESADEEEITDRHGNLTVVGAIYRGRHRSATPKRGTSPRVQPVSLGIARR